MSRQLKRLLNSINKTSIKLNKLADKEAKKQAKIKAKQAKLAEAHSHLQLLADEVVGESREDEATALLVASNVSIILNASIISENENL